MEKPHPVEPSGDEASAPPRPTLLVVDDNDLNREMFSTFFKRKCGYDVLDAEDGKQALEIVETRSVDLVLLDWMMPEMSGLDVLKALREHRSRTVLPVIMVTAKDQNEDVVEALNLGANDYIVKPIDLPVAQARVQTQLALKRLTHELEQKNRFIQRTFGRHLSEEVVANLLETPEGRLDGEMRTVTLLMSDLRNFTALAERLSPRDVVRLLNNYLGGMADVITRYQGTIDEFIGDAIMALFGAPAIREDDAERAVACAVAMQLAMPEINEKNRKDGLPLVEMGVAVNTGEVIVGNIGSETRTKYGVVGTPVNLTSRIQSFTRGGQVLISAATYKAVRPAVRIGEEMSLNARGFPAPVRVHELLAVHGRHSLELPRVEETVRPLARPLPVRFSVLHGEQVSGDEREGRLTQAFDKFAEITCDRAPDKLSKLRVRASRPDGTEVPGDVYATVVDVIPGGVRIRFMSYAPEVAKLIAETLVPGP